jgi:hypothetical protein
MYVKESRVTRDYYWSATHWKQIKCESGTKHLVTYFIFYFFRESQIELRQQIDLVAEGNIHTVICQNYSVTSNIID